ncbi:MAG: transglycosylase domain-containing protein, partial [Gammaproteobacteria bacterium]
YLNKIFLGHRSYGFQAASFFYYDKPLASLNLAQLAMLAGLPKAPSSINPVSNPNRASKRRDYVLGRMRELSRISEVDY